jgi:hypothetical protein
MKDLHKKARETYKEYVNKTDILEERIQDFESFKRISENNIFNKQAELEKQRERVTKQEKYFVSRIEDMNKIELSNQKLEAENNMLDKQIKAQSESIKGYKEQIKDLVEKLASITEKAVEKKESINDINVSNHG